MAIFADKGPLETSKRGTSGVPVFIQDQTTGVLDLPFLREANTYTLASPTVVNDRTITLTTSPTPAIIG